MFLPHRNLQQILVYKVSCNHFDARRLSTATASPNCNGISDLGRVADYIASDKYFCFIGDFTSSFKNTSRKCGTALFALDIMSSAAG